MICMLILTFLSSFIIYKHFSAAQVVQYLIAIAIFFTYALQFYVPTSIIWDGIKERFPAKKHLLYYYIMRFILVTGTGNAKTIIHFQIFD